MQSLLRSLPGPCRWLCVTVLYGLGTTGCSYNITQAVVHYSNAYPGHRPSEVAATLGQPTLSRRYSPPVAGSKFADAPPEVQKSQVSLYEEYRISGLVATQGTRINGMTSEANALLVELTLGASELIALPVTLIDLTARSTQRYRLRLWYNGTDRLIGVERRNVWKPLPPDYLPDS